MDIIIYPSNKHYKSLIISKVTNNIDLGDQPITQTYDKIVIFFPYQTLGTEAAMSTMIRLEKP